MKEKELINWIKRLVEVFDMFKNSQGQERTDRLNILTGYIASAEFILEMLDKPKQHE